VINKRMDESLADSEFQDGFDLPASVPESLMRLFDYWQSLPRDGAALPRRSDFDPLDLRGLWSNLMLLQIERQGVADTRLRVRYAGDRHDLRHGVTLAGKYLDDILRETELHRLQTAYLEIARRGAPHYQQGRHPMGRRGPTAYQRLIAPMADDAGDCSFLVGVWHWELRQPDAANRIG
jgi:hypothetical protein